MNRERNVIVFRTSVFGTWREKFGGIAAYAKSAGWMLHSVDSRIAKPDFKQLIRYWDPVGIVIDASASPETFDREAFEGLPVVAMNPEGRIRGRSMPSVSSDSRQIAKLAVSELLHGNPASLLFVEWFKPEMSWSATRKAECAEIAKMHGLPFKTATPKPGDAANPAALERHIAAVLQTMPRPCGVFAVTDALGAATLSAAARLKADIPGEIAVVSVDDDPEICENSSPTLTSVRPDFHSLGFRAGQMLDDMIAGRADALQLATVPPVGIVQRASSRKTRVHDRMVCAALEKIRLHACERLTPEDVAKGFPVSRRMAEIRFKTATGRTIGEEILERRLAAALGYLAGGRTSISAIADFCGWNSLAAFRKTFKDRFGVSPSKFTPTPSTENATGGHGGRALSAR